MHISKSRSRRLVEKARDFFYRGLGLRRLQHALENHVTRLLDEKLTHHFTFQHPINIQGDQLLIYTVDHQRLFLDSRELFMALHLLEHREWETHIRFLMRTVLAKDSLFVDVGANIGVHTLFAATLVGEHGHILACEPDPVTKELLRRNLEINGLLERIEIISDAASFIDGAVTSFDSFVEHPAMSGFKVSQERLKLFNGTVQTIDVKTVTLDTLLANRIFTHILIKIDVEGFEYNVLRGCERLVIAHRDVSFMLEYEKVVAESVMYLDVIKDIAHFFDHSGFHPYSIEENGLRALTYEQLLEEKRGDYYFVRQQNIERVKKILIAESLANSQ